MSLVLSEAAGIAFWTLGVKAAGGPVCELAVLGAAPGPRAGPRADPFGSEATGSEATGSEATGSEAIGNGSRGSASDWNWACWIGP
jgi:hypothetical protein